MSEIVRAVPRGQQSNPARERERTLAQFQKLSILNLNDFTTWLGEGMSALVCALSGEVPTEPVVSTQSGLA